MLRMEKKKFVDTVILQIIIQVIAVGMVFYHLIYTQYLLQGSIAHQDTHLGFALLLSFLAGLMKRKRAMLYFLTFIALSLAATIYIWVFIEELHYRAGFPNTVDTVVGALLILIVLVACRNAFGNIFAGVISVFIGYGFLGQFLPTMFYHEPYSVSEIVAYSVMSFTGMFGTALGTSANYIFLFVVFGAMLQETKVTDFFLELGKLIGAKLRSGPGQSAVVASALIGMCMGIQSANVAITGSFTIPLMKKKGYSPVEAGAIESAASSGGQIMPPIMGASAFLMAGFLGIPYTKVIIMAAIPALLYFLCVGISVHFIAERRSLPFSDETVNMRVLWTKGPAFFIPVGLLVYLLFSGNSPTFSIFWTIVCLLVVSSLRKETRLSPRRFISGCTRGAIVGGNLGVACAGIGIVMITMTTTGLGPKLAGLVSLWSGDILVVALFISAGIAIILGCGAPTVAAYIIVAVIVSPALVRMGVNVFEAHMFCFYFAILSGVTPPVAVAAMVGAELAGGDFWKTSIVALKIAMGGFVVAFLFMWSPTLLLLPEDVSLAVKVIIFASTLLGLSALLSCLHGWFIANLNLVGRLILLGSAFGFLGFVITKSPALLAGGTIIFVVHTAWQLWRKRNAREHFLPQGI